MSALKRACLLLVAITLVLALPACGPAEPPKSAEPFHVSVDLARGMTPEEAEFVDGLKSTFSMGSGAQGARMEFFRPLFLRDDAMVREVFPDALFPRETLGRRLVAIVYRKLDNASPSPAVVLVYEGELAVYEWPYYSEIGGHKLPDPTVETTRFGDGLEGELTTNHWRGDGIESARLKWQVGRNQYSVTGRGLTRAEALRVAESMAP
jgi:hypothetical protein